MASLHTLPSDILVEALKFYAAERNWQSASIYMCGHSGYTNAQIDGGNKARVALEKFNNENS
jgi:hypothetical protein